MFCKSDCGIFLDIVTESLRIPQLLVNGSQKDDILSTFSSFFSMISILALQSSVLTQDNHKYRKILAPFYRYVPKFISCFTTSLFLP